MNERRHPSGGRRRWPAAGSGGGGPRTAPLGVGYLLGELRGLLGADPDVLGLRGGRLFGLPERRRGPLRLFGLLRLLGGRDSLRPLPRGPPVGRGPPPP